MKIVTIGGGTGNPVVNESLLLAGIKYIHTIVSVMDSGGITGRMRTDSRGEEIAYSDGLRSLLSLLPPSDLETPKVKALKEILRRRNDRGQDLGYTIFSHYFNAQNGFEEIQKLLETLTSLSFSGLVIPVTLKSTNILFETQLRNIYKGEHELDDKRMSADMVKRMWLDPQVETSPQAAETIKNSDFIFFSCGSLHGSVLANLLPTGITEALSISKATKVYITNLASTRNETHNFTPTDFIKIFQKYSKLQKPIDVLVIPNLTRKEFDSKFPKVAKQYAMSQAHFLGWGDREINKVKQLGVRVIKHNATLVDPVLERIRHNPKTLSESLKNIVSNHTQ